MTPLLRGSRQDRAHEIIVKWADLDSSGKLEKRKETEVEGEFLTQIFGEAAFILIKPWYN